MPPPPPPPTPLPAPVAPPAGPVCGGPRAALDRGSHDFGLARQQAELVTEFTLTNVGDAPLHVTAVLGTCSCTDGSISSREIAPGATATVRGIFRTYTLVGPYTKSVKVESDDPVHPVLELKLSVDISAGIVLEPEAFTFDPALIGTSPTASILARWKEGSGRPFKILGVEATGTTVEFDVTPADAPPWRGWKIALRFPTPPPVGPIQGTARIRTDDPDVPTIQAAILGSVSGRVFLAQRFASVGMVPEGRGSTLLIPCRGFDATIDLGEVTAKSRKGIVSARALRDPKDAKAWQIEIALPVTAPAGPVVDVVEVTTGVAGEEHLEIRVGGIVTKKRPEPPAPGK